VSLFSPLIKSYSSPIPKYKHTPDTVIYLLLWHTHTVMMVYFPSRTSTDKVHTVQMLSKDMILASFSLIWQVKILSYSPVWQVPSKSESHPWWQYYTSANVFKAVADKYNLLDKENKLHSSYNIVYKKKILLHLASIVVCKMFSKKTDFCPDCTRI
jgi:hypothetical protein